MPRAIALRPLALALVGLVLLGCSGSTPSGAAPTAETALLSPSAGVSTSATPATETTPGTPNANEKPRAPAAPTPAPTPPPEPATPMVELERTLAELVDRHASPGEFAVAVTDLWTGETVGVALDRPHLAACSINFFVLLQATLDVQERRYDERVVDELITATIWSSNPVTAHELYGVVGDGDVIEGVRRTAALATDLGGSAIVLDHPPLYAADSLGVDRNNWVTARAMNDALWAVHAGELLDDARLAALLDAMTVVKPGLNYLLAVGPDEPVSHKNGFFEASDGTWVDNDIGIVRFEQDGVERAYAISFFSQWVPEKYGDVALGQRLSAAAWAFFQHRYPSSRVSSGPTTASGTRRTRRQLGNTRRRCCGDSAVVQAPQNHRRNAADRGSRPTNS